MPGQKRFFRTTTTNYTTESKTHTPQPKQTNQPHTTNTLPLQILNTPMVKNITSVILCANWPLGIPGLPEVKNVSRHQYLNLISVLKINNWPRFRMDIIQILTDSELVSSALTWTNMTALVYFHICLKALCKYAWNSAREGTELVNNRLRAFFYNMNFLGPQIQVETYVWNLINSLT